MFEKIGEIKTEDLHKLREGQEHCHIEVKGDLGVGEAAPAKAVVVKKIIQTTTVFDGIDDSTFFMHALQLFAHVFIKANALEEPVKEPAEEKSRFVIEHKRKKGLNLHIIHNLFTHPHTAIFIGVHFFLDRII